VSRAVAPLKDLWKWGKPLLKRAGGRGQKAEELPVPNGLICLKGGDLSQEIADSKLHPRIMEVYEIFDIDVFKEKYILYVPL